MRVFETGLRINWRYALGEIILIVVGVSIALAASSWYGHWQDRQDEQIFISSLHVDIQLAEELTSRVRDRRLETLASLITASEVIYQGEEQRSLTDKECDAIALSSNFNINLSELPSAAELASTGRMAIIQDSELRQALVGMLQIKGTFPVLIYQLEVNTADLSLAFSDLISRDTYIDPNSGEVRIRAQCETDKMRVDQAFVNQLAVNLDQYDVYIRDGLKIWFDQIEQVHELVDQSLGIHHD